MFLSTYRAHPFAKKEWYNVLVPGFDKRVATLMPCNKTAGQVQASDNLRGRVISISLDDCNNPQKKEQMSAWRKLKFQVDEIKGFDCYTNFHGMDITRDHGCAMIKKWHSLIESFVQAKTTDGYIVRMFAIAFTKKTPRQVKATCYAKASKKKQIRQKMMEIMTSTIQKSSLRDLVNILYVFLSSFFSLKSILLMINFICVGLREMLANKFKKNAALKSSHCKKTAASLERSRSSRSQDSILPSLWNFTRTSQRRRKLPQLQKTLSLRPLHELFDITGHIK